VISDFFYEFNLVVTTLKSTLREIHFLLLAFPFTSLCRLWTISTRLSVCTGIVHLHQDSFIKKLSLHFLGTHPFSLVLQT
jgi:hypothetical protein